MSYINKRFIIIILNIFIICMFSGCYSENQYSNTNNMVKDELTIDVFNVGKADCILIGIKSKYIMIDTGLDKYKDDISKYLKSEGINELEYLILTHMDKDHIGGADKIINEVKINNLIQPDYKKESNQYEEYEEAVKKNNIKPTLLHNEIQTEINDLKINIYPPEKNEYKKSNDYSIIVDIMYKNQSFLFMGDAEQERIEEFLKYPENHYTVIKMPHHGRFNKLTESLIKRTSPQYSIITCSEEETADKETISVLDKYNVLSYLTEHGTITIKSDGNNTLISQ